jgi:prepilin-type N-terminal cleavage/methylation domain-containing protein
VKTPLSKSGGFTLIEIMMVVAIIGLTLTMGLPSFYHSLHKEGMAKAESELVEACQNARRDAIMGNHTAELVINPLEGTFLVPGAYDQKELSGDVRIDILGVNFIDLTKAEQARVHFFPNGTSDEFTIIISSAGGAVREIDLDTIAALPVVKTIR